MKQNNLNWFWFKAILNVNQYSFGGSVPAYDMCCGPRPERFWFRLLPTNLPRFPKPKGEYPKVEYPKGEYS